MTTDLGGKLSTPISWLDRTDFGVYALCPAGYVDDWDGTEALDTVSEHVGKIRLPDHGEVLTLGGEALPVAYFPQTMTFVRTIGHDDESGLHDAVERSEGAAGWRDDVEICLGGCYFLIDSMAPGAEAGEEYSIRVDVPPGRYRVQSLFIAPPMGEFYLHRLRAVPAPAAGTAALVVPG
ncbi:Imm21 family immunity protein [Streptomyces sp. NPDC012888]|uniref:Imm21 family immunity protein n=1 Tax=Streptomyces sp. NPDC012888 TaxID=3364855 RepID=UPI0036A0993F